jgi:DNA-binding transcriptional ArsR family regulator
MRRPGIPERNGMPAVVGHAGPVSTGTLSAAHALAALAALGQPTRLDIFRLLIREPDGLPAGTLAEAIGCPQNTLSSHLGILARAGLVRGTRAGRTITYRADIAGMRDLIGFLASDCCDGHPDLCALPAPRRRQYCSGAAKSASRRGRKR